MDYIKIVKERVGLKEGNVILEQYLKKIFIRGAGISSKQLSVELNIPVPLVVAIKKEFIKCGILKQGNGIEITEMGCNYVEQSLGYYGLKLDLYKLLLTDEGKRNHLVKELCEEYGNIYKERPQADVTIDQAKATIETAFKRAMLCLQYEMLINKKILCLGDDDLVSIAIGLLLKRLYKDTHKNISQIIVFDIDKRISAYIRKLAEDYYLPIKVVKLDLREPLPISFANYFDVLFMDPPYTIEGVTLFLSRGISALKKEKGGKVFLSFGNKAPNEMQKLQKVIINHGLFISSVLQGFNHYEGASLLGGSSQMLILDTTDFLKTMVEPDKSYFGKLYTADFKENTKKYICKNCGEEYVVGKKQEIKTIEILKTQGCTHCGGKIFIQQNGLANRVNGMSEKILGRHILADFFECSKREISDVELIQKYMHEAADKANASIVTEEFHHFCPWGVSGAIIIKESHLTIHTWPEYGYAAVDIFTCGNSLDLWKALFILKDRLKCKRMEHNEIARGKIVE